MFGWGTDRHGGRGSVLERRRSGFEEFGRRREALGAGGGDAFGAHGLAANSVGCLRRKVGEPGCDVRRCGDQIFFFALFAEFGEGDDGAFWAGCEDAGSTHKLASDLECCFKT